MKTECSTMMTRPYERRAVKKLLGKICARPREAAPTESPGLRQFRPISRRRAGAHTFLERTRGLPQSQASAANAAGEYLTPNPGVWPTDFSTVSQLSQGRPLSASGCGSKATSACIPQGSAPRCGQTRSPVQRPTGRSSPTQSCLHTSSRPAAALAWQTRMFVISASRTSFGFATSWQLVPTPLAFSCAMLTAAGAQGTKE